jgi:Arc/MetJ family transcription regulator
MSNRKTSVLIDEELLVAVKAVLNTKTVKDTIERAFLEVLRAKAREEEVEALSIQKGMELNDDEVMSRAWRH